MKARYLLGKNDRRLEAYAHIAHGIDGMLQEARVFAVIGSNIYEAEKDELLRRVSNALYNRDKRVLLIQSPISNYANDQVVESKEVYYDCAEVTCADVSVVSAYLKQAKEAYDVILFNLPPLYLSAVGVEYAGLCDAALMVERYGYTKMAQYENNLAILEEYHIPVRGVMTYR